MGIRERSAFRKYKRAHHLTGDGGKAVRGAHRSGYTEATKAALKLAEAAATGAHQGARGGGPGGDPHAHKKALDGLIRLLREEAESTSHR